TMGNQREWGKPFGQAGPEQNETWHATKRRDMSWTRIVANERAGAIHQGQQLRNGSRRDYIFFPRPKPPTCLVRVTSDLYLIVLLRNGVDQLAKAIQWPNARWLAGARVDKYFSVPPGRRERKFIASRQLETQGSCHHPPMLVSVPTRIGAHQRMGQKNLAP